MGVLDPAVLDDLLRGYTGEALRWEGFYVAIDAAHVLALIVAPSRLGDPIHFLHRASVDERGNEIAFGSVYVRKGARTLPADDADYERLRTRAQLLRVEPTWNVGDKGYWIGIRTMNPPGARETAIVYAGFIVGRGQIEIPARGGETGDGKMRDAETLVELRDYEHPQLLAGGQQLVERVLPSQVPPYLDEDSQFVPFVVDAAGDRHIGRPVAFFRKLIDGGWIGDTKRPDPLARFGFGYTADDQETTVVWFDAGDLPW